MARDKEKLNSRDCALTTIHQTNNFIQTLEYQSQKDKFSNAQMILFQYAMASINKDDTEFKKITLTPDEIKQLTGVNLDGSNRKKWIKNFLQMSKKMFVYASEETIITGAFFSYTQYNPKTNEYIYALHPLLNGALLSLANTGHNIYQFGWVWSLSSAAQSLYSIANSVSDLKRNKLYYSIEKLKKVIGYFGETKHFVAQHLRPAIDEINEHTNIDIAVTPVKEGKTIVGFVLECAKKSRVKMEKELIVPMYPDENNIFKAVPAQCLGYECPNPVNKIKIRPGAEGMYQKAILQKDFSKVFNPKEITIIPDIEAP